jgi:hypothetical protein
MLWPIPVMAKPDEYPIAYSEKSNTIPLGLVLSRDCLPGGLLMCILERMS